MSIRFKLPGKRAKALEVEAPHECGHWDLAPRWACNEDIGKDDMVTYYTCSTCGLRFSREDAAELRRSS